MVRVLIVDDNVGLAENIAEILEFDGHATEVAASAEEALPKAALNAPDVVITDYRLPGMTGADFVRAYLGQSRLRQAVVISAYTDDLTMNDARSAGATFVPKPVDLSVLCRIVREANA